MGLEKGANIEMLQIFNDKKISAFCVYEKTLISELV